LDNYANELGPYDLLDKPVRAVRLVMVSRANRPDPYNKSYEPIPAINHVNVGPSDGHMRRFLENVVQLRNY
jgi:hypothetical protein